MGWLEDTAFVHHLGENKCLFLSCDSTTGDYTLTVDYLFTTKHGVFRLEFISIKLVSFFFLVWVVNEIGLEGDPDEISNNFNNFLLFIIPNLLSSLENLPHDCQIEINNQSMFLKPVSLTELCNISKQIKNKHSSGIDEVPTSIVKVSIPEIPEVLCHLINNSFKYGIFPDQLKMALIKPLYKKGDPRLMENYRPISLLPSFSKLFELAMCRRLMDFLNKCSILSEH